MALSRAERKARLILRIDGDRFGLFAASLVGFVVMLLSMFKGNVQLGEACFRSGVAFVVVYAVTYVTVKFIQSTARPELIPKKKRIVTQEQAAGSEGQPGGGGIPGEAP